MAKLTNMAGSIWRSRILRYAFFTLLAFIPLVITVHSFTVMLIDRGDEPISFLIATYFIAGVYVGMYMAQIWTNRYKIIPVRFFILLSIVIVASLVLIFFTVQFSIVVQKHFLSLLFIALPLLIMSLCTGMLIRMVRSTVTNQLQEARSDAAQSNSELKLLQSQLSPHFLFNTLNNIYGISLSRHERVPPLLLKLSDLLRYSVYDAREQFVPLKNELEYIHNYIDFEKIRVGEKLVLTTELEYHIDPKIRIVPLLLIIFIENAFKHAKNTTEQKIFIDIKLKVWGKNILFSVKNSSQPINVAKGVLNEHSGFGLDNVRKRLELLYKNEYTLNIDDEDDHYIVVLQVKSK
jgi:sensor histidine kinase YesM